jgi:hypothetical protein
MIATPSIATTERAAWLPPGKHAAVCLSVDDVHPAPVALEALDHVRWLQEQHAGLRVTFFTTPEWRTREPYPIRPILRRIPLLRDRVFTVPVESRGTYRLDRHPAFCDAVRGWTRAETAVHGLYHVRRGMRPIQEFAHRSRRDCRAVLQRAMARFHAADLPFVRGMSPPGWEAPMPLLHALDDLGFAFIASARDLTTPIASTATTNGSGLQGVSLIHPQRVHGGLVHFTTNYQATSRVERGLDILDAGGLLAIKAHLLAQSGTYRALDGLTLSYREHLHELFTAIARQYGDAIWWTSMGEIAARMRA